MLLMGWTSALLFEILSSTTSGVDRAQERHMDALTATYADGCTTLHLWDRANSTVNVMTVLAPKLLIRLPKKLLFGGVKGCRPQVALGLVSMMLHQVTGINAAALGCTRMLRTDFFGKTRLVLHLPSSS